MNGWGYLTLVVLLGVLLSSAFHSPPTREGATCPALETARGLVATSLGAPTSGPPLTEKEKQMGQLCQLAQQYVDQVNDNVTAVNAVRDAAKDHMRQTIGTASPDDISAKADALHKS